MKIIFFTLLLISSTSFAEFSQNNLRYLSGYDFQNRLDVYFGLVFVTKNDGHKHSMKCLTNRTSIGFSNPSTGAPISNQPTQSTVQFIDACIDSIFLELGSIFKSLKDEEKKDFLVLFLTEKGFNKLTSKMNLKDLDLSLSMSNFSEEEKRMIIDNLVLQFLGTDEVIQSYNLITNVDEFRKFLYGKVFNVSIGDNLKRIVKILVLRDEFLTY